MNGVYIIAASAPSPKGKLVKSFANASDNICLQLYHLKLNCDQGLVSVLQAPLKGMGVNPLKRVHLKLSLWFVFFRSVKTPTDSGFYRRVSPPACDKFKCTL